MNTIKSHLITPADISGMYVVKTTILTKYNKQKQNKASIKFREPQDEV